MNSGFILIILLGIISLAWINPQADLALKGNKLYNEGRYDQAMEKYGQALIELPEDPILHFNMGNTVYKKEDYQQAEKSYTKVLASTDRRLEAWANYNLGNSKYRQGRLKENTNLSEAIESYRQALNYYRQAMELDPDDKDAKFNHEFVERRIKDLMSKLNQQQQNQQQQKEQQPEQPQENQPQESKGEDKSQSQQEQEQIEGHEDQAKHEQEQQKEENVQADQESQQAQEQKQEQKGEQRESVAADEEKREMSEQEANMLLDSLRDEELGQINPQGLKADYPQVYKDW